ncbi:MAG: pantetheine-phosphate adenylyltransferase [Candidatus Omnitrophica bacterium]|nr:pantetheine-phosphate adenylyltransferase [Candidatus Omnitrophota bacterium]
MASTTAVYPGTFDPVTYGHLDLIERARRLFESVRVAVAANPGKLPLFTAQERVALLRRALRGRRGITVEAFDGLVVAYARRHRAPVVIRGLRMLSDFEYEFQMALTNRKLDARVETLFLMPSESYAYLSSKLIKETASLGADVRAFVPGFVAERLTRRLRPSGSPLPIGRGKGEGHARRG